MSAEEVLFHGQDVMLVSGRHIAVNPWGIRAGRKMMGRIKTLLTLFKAASGGNLDLEALFEGSYDELVSLTADTIDVPIKDLQDEKQYLLEDLVALLTAIVEVNFLKRPQFVGKISSLLKMMETEEAESETPETPTNDSPLS